MPTLDLPVSPAAVLRRLAVGWSVPDALFALIDNSVQAGASNVWVHVRRAEEVYGDTRKNNVAAYEIVDDGDGMDAAGLLGALELGASADDYGEHSLSKFGLGLKAAAFSQGERLELISSDGSGPFEKRVVSVPDVEASGAYEARHEPLSDTDRSLVDLHLPGGQGTVVRIAGVRMDNHPRVKDTLDEIRYRAGVIYYYFLNDDERGFTLTVDDEPIEPYDPLWTTEADANGNLDEATWAGKTAEWIRRPTQVTLDADATPPVRATIEVTQLPHPPTFEFEPDGKALGLRAQTRDRYRIGAGNYGYYVYRNRRLISWAERFGGIVPQNVDYYAFRGRILIDETADEAFNIDVKKADLNLSDAAQKYLDDLTADYKRKSREAWEKMSAEYTERKREDASAKAEEIAAAFTPDDEPDGVTSPEPEQGRNEREAEYQDALTQAARREAARKKAEETGKAADDVEVTPEDVAAVVRGDANPAAQHIFRVERLDDDVMWSPYLDAEHDRSVRINRHHRFARLVFSDNSDNADLQVLFELLLFHLALAEGKTVRQLDDLKRADVERVLAQFRRYASNNLADLCRELEAELPPFKPER